MKTYIELSKYPTERIIQGKLGFSLLYKVTKVNVNGTHVNMNPSDVYYSKEFGGLCSIRSKSAKAKQLSLNKDGKYTLREKIPGTAFSRAFTVHSDEVAYAASQLL
jgi:hypothetical protein